MASDFELQLLQELEELKRKVRSFEEKTEQKIPTYQYSKIRDRELNALFEIEKTLDAQRFEAWFHTPVDLEHGIHVFLSELLDQNKLLIESYSEEDLKVHMIVPILNKVRFTSYEKKIRDFYELPMTYATSRFILSGTVDFVVSEGLVESKKPYFFIQEFKHSEDYGNPRPQLLAEMISALELNDWASIKGAYIIGGSWHFVIVDKVAPDHYQYVISQNFDSTKIGDLTSIYKHLVVIKHEILSMVEGAQEATRTTGI